MAALAEWNHVLTTLLLLRGVALKRYGYLLSGDRAEAEDLVQDALVRAFTFPRRTEVIELERYVRKIMLNIYLDRVRRRRVWQRLMPLLATQAQKEPQEHADMREDLRLALLELSARQRACVVLYYYLDLSIAEITEELGLSPGTIKRHLHDARRQLGRHLGSPKNTTENGYATT